MTFYAAKARTSNAYSGVPHVDVHVTYGPVSVKVTEDAGHLRSFHGELGRLLDQIEQEQKTDVKPIGWQGATQHTYTPACAGNHAPGPCPEDK